MAIKEKFRMKTQWKQSITIKEIGERTYVDLNGALVAPIKVLNATSWNGPAIFPRGNHPRSPPFFPDGHSEYSAANWDTNQIVIKCCYQLEIYPQKPLISIHRWECVWVVQKVRYLCSDNVETLIFAMKYRWIGKCNNKILAITACCIWWAAYVYVYRRLTNRTQLYWYER